MSDGIVANVWKYFAGNLKKLSIISSSNIATQAISLVSFIFIARIYSENQVGEYVTFLAYVGIISIISTGYYDQALYVEKRPARVKLLRLIPILFALVSSAFAGIVLSLAEVPFAAYIVISVFAGGVSITAVNINISQNRLIFASLFRLVAAPLIPLAVIGVGWILEQKVNG